MKKWVVPVTLTVLFVFLMVSGAYAAADMARVDGKIVVALETENGAAPLSNISVSLFRVADVELVGGEYSFTKAGDFTGSAATLEIGTSEQHSQQAALLVTFARNNRLTPKETKVTGTNGSVEFDMLVSGLYLVMQTNGSVGAGYRFSPVLVPLPFLSKTAESVGEWEFEVTSWPKTEYIPPSGGDSYWEPPTTYTPVTVPPVSPPASQPDAGELVVVEGEVPLAGALPPDEEVLLPEPQTPLGNLPQTGLLVWPIAVLSVSGLLMVVSGVYLGKRSKKYHER